MAIAATGGGFAAAVTQLQAPDSNRLLHGTVHPSGQGEQARRLKALVEQMHWSGRRCRWVLNVSDFRILNAFAPEVAAHEMREALRWRIQDMIDFPVDDAEIEFFPMPASRQAGREQALSVLACRRATLRAYTELCEEAGLVLDAIDVPQLCLRNLTRLLPESQRGVAVLQLAETSSVLQLQKDAVIYITREMEIGSVHLHQALTSENAEAVNQVIERLALEIQRSLDYYESHYGMPPVAGLVVAPIPECTQRLVDGLNQSLGVIARAMDVGALLDCDERLDDATQQLCLSAIGSALQRELAA